jgi:hypothetical protein
MGPIADWQCNWYFKREAGISPMSVRGRDGLEAAIGGFVIVRLNGVAGHCIPLECRHGASSGFGISR